MATCSVCGGTGIVDGDICTNCMHTGVTPIRGKVALTRKKLFDIEDKNDSIIAEQASQRTDLTAALTQIWNKVKDL